MCFLTTTRRLAQVAAAASITMNTMLQERLAEAEQRTAHLRRQLVVGGGSPPPKCRLHLSPAPPMNDPPTELLDQLAAIALCDDDSGTSDDEVGVAVDLRHRPAGVGQLCMLQSAATVNSILATLISKGRGIVVPILRWTYVTMTCTLQSNAIP